MTPDELNQWTQDHRGIRGRERQFRNEPDVDSHGYPIPGASHQVEEGVKITALDGAVLVLRRNPTSVSTAGPGANNEYDVIDEVGPPPPPAQTPRSAEQQRADAATATSDELTAAAKQEEQRERWWNQNKTDEGGSGLPETHLERATREARVREEQRQAQQLRDQEAQQQRASQAQEAANQIAQQRETREAGTATAQTEISRGTLTLAQQREQREAAQANRPQVLPSDTKAPKITQYNPATGQIESQDNPNYDPVKAAAEEKRLELASQIAARQINLEEAKQQYSQWFDTNVKTPMMLAQEQRAKAEEQRAALDAEERRRQFAATFGLQKATLGQQAAATAIQAEESLLPYRAGPNEAAHMSDAINGLAAGGTPGGPSAGAGIHFSGDDFQFNAPDFAAIAKKATHAVLSGLTDYRPSDQQYQTADYSSVPQVNLSGMPSYSYSSGGGSSLPAPSAGADQPTQ